MNKLISVFFFLLFMPVFIVGCNNHDVKETKIEEGDTLTKPKETDTCRIKIITGTYLGNERRNFYGDSIPSGLDIIWQVSLGSGKTVKTKDPVTWSGAGWTGQPLYFIEDSTPFLIQGTYSHNLKKINALTGKVVWEYPFDDVIKGTGSVWVNEQAVNYANKYVLLQGSRRGLTNTTSSRYVPSYRAVSYLTGKELWRYNSKRTPSYSRDVDGSALIIDNLAYLGLETGIFIVFDPNPDNADTLDNMLQPSVLYSDTLYDEADILKHGGNLVTESSPSRLGNHVYITSGSGHVYGYNLTTKTLDWDFYTGSDIDGSPIVTNDSCILVAIEKQYINGRGGVFKLDPSKSPDSAVVWFFPVENKEFAEWKGGIIGSVSTNDYTNTGEYPAMAAFTAIDGNLYVVDYKNIRTDSLVVGHDGVTRYKTPKLIFKKKGVGPSISTPIIIKNRLVAAGYRGIHLFEFDKDMNFKLLESKDLGAMEATPIAIKGRIYVASRNGNLYCFGKK